MRAEWLVFVLSFLSGFFAGWVVKEVLLNKAKKTLRDEMLKVYRERNHERPTPKGVALTFERWNK